MNALRSIPVWAAMSICACAGTPAARAIGGDTCGTATTITGLPFIDAGFTCGFQDDCDEICPFDAPGSPDVVYVYSPLETQFVEVSLCAGSNYDTKLYVYQGTCGAYQSGLFVACSDDFCPTPNMPNPWVSQVSFAAMSTSIYYIVVDGYGGGCGNYTIEVKEADPPACPPNTLFGQPPSTPIDVWAFLASDLDFSGSDPPNTNGIIRYESFSEVAGPICDLHWAGLTLVLGGDSLVPCSEVPMDFRIAFWTDSAGLPGSLFCEYWVTPDMEPTGIFFNIFQLYLRRVDLEPLGCCQLDQGWISIQGTNGPSCWFHWGSSQTGDGTSLLDLTNGTGIQTKYEDLNVCLTGHTGACCLFGGACGENVTPGVCAAEGGIDLGDGTVCELGCVPPPNDHCETAAFLPLPGHTIASTAMADSDPTPFCGTSSPHQGVWYVVEGTGGFLRATTCNPNSGFDTKIQVFCDCGDFTCVGGNDDSSGPAGACTVYGWDLLSAYEWCSAPGQLYFIKVGGYGEATGQFELTVTDEEPCALPASCEPVIGQCCHQWCP